MKTVAQTVIEADRFYTIAAKGGSVIQAVEKATNGGDIRLGKYEHKPEQEWAFVREGDGVYRIRNRASGKLIDPPAPSVCALPGPAASASIPWAWVPTMVPSCRSGRRPQAMTSCGPSPR